MSEWFDHIFPSFFFILFINESYLFYFRVYNTQNSAHISIKSNSIFITEYANKMKTNINLNHKPFTLKINEVTYLIVFD